MSGRLQGYGEQEEHVGEGPGRAARLMICWTPSFAGIRRGLGNPGVSCPETRGEARARRGATEPSRPSAASRRARGSPSSGGQGEMAVEVARLHQQRRARKRFPTKANVGSHLCARDVGGIGQKGRKCVHFPGPGCRAGIDYAGGLPYNGCCWAKHKRGPARRPWARETGTDAAKEVSI